MEEIKKENWEDKSNNEILMAVKGMQVEHEAIKVRMLKNYDDLVALEKDFAKANKILNERLKGG